MDEQTVKLAFKMATFLKDETTSHQGFWEVGGNYFIRTVTHHFTGRLVLVTPQELWIEDAAWIADSGRFAQAIESGVFAEVEPYPSGKRIAIGRGALIDAHKIDSSLPRSQK